MKFGIFITLLLVEVLCAEKNAPSVPKERTTFEYMLINGASVLVSGILLAQVSLISDSWLLLASIPSIIVGVTILAIDQTTRKSAPINFLKGGKSKYHRRPWLDVLQIVQFPSKPNDVDLNEM